jgi:hypothetical protein
MAEGPLPDSARDRRRMDRERQRRRDDPPEENHPTATWVAGLITSLIKIGGLVIAGNEALLSPSPHDPVVFAVAAFMMAGAQGLDSLLNSALGNRK